jgi:zinc/manganese transport system ATP-binding protein
VIVLLDLDGTVWDSEPGIVACLRPSSNMLALLNVAEPVPGVVFRDLVALGTLAAPADEPRLAITEALQSMGLASLADTRLSQLSGGQQQRALLARALVQKADLLLLDEPFTYLDPPTRQQLLAVLRQQASGGRIVLVSSHDWGDSLQGYDRALLLDTTLRADDRPDRVLERLQRP